MYICGVDEVGRGPLAGPVVAAAVILPDGFSYKGLRDSKKMTQKARLKSYDYIIQNAIAWAIAQVECNEIDNINILEATKAAMIQAVNKLQVKPDVVNVDGNQTIDIPYQCNAIINGDDSNIEIAAASVLAKVYRDNIMCELDLEYPEYGFAAHKGYGTKLHLEMLNKFGPSCQHRYSFAPVKKLIKA